MSPVDRSILRSFLWREPGQACHGTCHGCTGAASVGPAESQAVESAGTSHRAGSLENNSYPAEESPTEGAHQNDTENEGSWDSM